MPAPEPSPVRVTWVRCGATDFEEAADSLRVVSDESEFGYQLMSQEIAVPPGMIPIVHIEGQIDSGIITIGLLDEKRARWIGSRSYDQGPFQDRLIFDPGRNRSMTLVIANAGTKEKSSFQLGPARVVMTPPTKDGLPQSELGDQGWHVGYSAAGEVMDVGDGVSDITVGDVVACAGAGKANHADFIVVPRNLVCRVPAGCEMKLAATTTVGAIALQGIRRAACQLGETIAVIGLGLIGQITAQMLRANGCRVLGMDSDPVCVPVYYVSKLARDNGVVVCQVGEGADELFFGYPHWKTALRLQRLNDLPVPRFVKRTALATLRSSGSHRSFRYEWLRRGISDEPIFWGGAEAFTEAHKKLLLSQRLRRKFKTYSSWEPVSEIFARFRERAWEKSIANWMTYVDLHMRLPELLLMRIDKMTMGVSLEGRVPFLDHRLVEFALSIPESVKTKKGALKPIFKKAVRGLIPDDLIDRKKQGFGVPISEWYFDRLGGRVRADMNAFCCETDFLDREEVFRLIESGSPQSWYLHNFVLWWKSFISV